jgi:hypothetical protein
MEVGVAVVLPDKRGCEKSEGEWLGRDFVELATDTAAAGKWVRQQELFAASGIGLIGMSQGIAGQIEIYPGGGHGIVDPDSHRVQPAFLSDLTGFVQESMAEWVGPTPQPPGVS